MVPTIRALAKLLMGANNIHGAEAGKALGDAVAANTVLKELDLSAQKVGRFGKALNAAFAKKFAIGVGANGALTSLNLASNYLRAEGAKHVAEAIKVNVSVLRFDWYHSELDLTSGSTAVVYGYCYYNTTKGALTSLDVSHNSLEGYYEGRGSNRKWISDMTGIKALAAAIPACK